MKIQLSPTRIVKDATTIWQDPGPEVDLTMDLKKLTFAENSVEAIYSFHVLDHLLFKDAQATIENWRSCLVPGGKLYIVVDDFEYIARSLVGGDITIDMFNEKFTHPAQFTRDNLIRVMTAAGFTQEALVSWMVDVPDLFPKEIFELVFSVTKL